MGIRSEETFPNSNTDVRERLGENYRDGQKDGHNWHSQEGHSSYRDYVYVILTLHILSVNKTTNKCT